MCIVVWFLFEWWQRMLYTLSSLYPPCHAHVNRYTIIKDKRPAMKQDGLALLVDRSLE